MWEDEDQRGRKIRKILIICSIVLVLILSVGFLLVRKLSNGTDVSSAESSAQTQSADDQKREEIINQINADYAKDMLTVETYLPGIVCWGDKITGGSVDSVSYASTLQDLIDENICDLYNFRGTLDYADNVSRVDWTDYTLEIPVINMGVGEETTNTILGRNGAVPYVLKKDAVIPAGIEPVNIRIISENGNNVAPLTAGNGGVNNVTIAGIEGTLSLVNEYSGEYTFTRLEAGTETAVEAGTKVITAASSMYRNYIPIILMGTYGGYSYDVNILVEQNKEIIEHQLGDNDRYIVLGMYAIDGDMYESNAAFYQKYDTAMEKAFGEHFINLRRYLISDGVSDLEASGANLSNTGSTDGMSAYDKILCTEGYVPNYMRVNEWSLELKGEVYKLIGQVVYNRMDSLGYFDEVNEELGIDDVVAQLKQIEVDKKLDGQAN